MSVDEARNNLANSIHCLDAHDWTQNAAEHSRLEQDVDDCVGALIAAAKESAMVEFSDDFERLRCQPLEDQMIHRASPQGDGAGE